MNKKHLLFLAIFITSMTAANAQLVKGDILAGATLGYNNGKQEMPNNTTSTTSNANLTPRLGFVVGKNSVVGILATVVHQKTESDNVNTTYNVYGGGLYWRKYLPIKNQFGWYVNVDGSVTTGKRKEAMTQPSSERITKVTNYGGGVTPGFYYQPLRNLLLSVDFGGVSYQVSNQKSKYANSPADDYKSKTSTFGFTMLSTFTFGVDFVIGRRRA